MSGIGFSELVILCLIGLIVLGPQRLPRVANQIGSWLGQARRMTRVMKRQLEEELDLEGKPDIRPPASRSTFPPKGTPTPGVDAEPGAPAADAATIEHDDTYSPAHGENEPGTGVGDSEAVPDKRADDGVASTGDSLPDDAPASIAAEASDRSDAHSAAADDAKHSEAEVKERAS
jgi:sec-independent protein translocase protein TatB